MPYCECGKNTEIFIHTASTFDPYQNLAYENALLEYVSRRTRQGYAVCGLFLWQSSNAVVFGRNQSITRECNMDVVETYQIRLVRRFSGGGAVYQDMGNLNFSFISSESVHSTQKNLDIILRALKKLGILAEASGRNDLVADGRKISGNAFFHSGQAVLHHGTLLVCEDLAMAQKCLSPDLYKLKANGVSSVRSRIINLADLSEACSVPATADRIRAEFLDTWHTSRYQSPGICTEAYEQTWNMLRSREWIMGHACNDCRTVHAAWGTLRYQIKEKDGCIAEFIYETDALELDFLDRLSDRLRGMPLSKKHFDAFVKNPDLEMTELEKDMMHSVINKIRKELV